MQDYIGDVLIVDDEPQICDLICEALKASHFRCHVATDSAQAIRLVDQQAPGVIVADVRMPETSGLDLLAYARQKSPGCKIILMTGQPSAESMAEALRLGAYDYIAKPFDIAELVEAVTCAISETDLPRKLVIKVAQAARQEPRLRLACLESIQTLVHAVEAKDSTTRLHSEHVAHYAVGLAGKLGLAQEATEPIRIASLVHDVGKIGIPGHILTKPGQLSCEEFQRVREHPAVGAKILGDIPVFLEEAGLVRHHHENWDGSGYPDGLAGERIPLGSRIIRVADSIDAMLMPRTYKKPLKVEQMLGELARSAGSQFEPRLANAAIEWCTANAGKMILQSGTA